jgi:hypothetical protein
VFWIEPSWILVGIKGGACDDSVHSATTRNMPEAAS